MSRTEGGGARFDAVRGAATTCAPPPDTRRLRPAHSLKAAARSSQVMPTLIIVSRDDEASTVQGDALLALGGWVSGPVVEGGQSWSQGDVHLWWWPGFVLREDDLDSRWTAATSVRPHEIIFPSRHRAESGRPSLTLHPIGVPHHLPGTTPPYGGAAGRAPPPNPRLAPWFRLLRELAPAHGLTPEFDLSLETTHHGPWLATPCLFIEIGSDESQYGRTDAAACLAEVMWRGLGLDGGGGVGDWADAAPVEWVSEPARVAVGLGGGHYAPRHGLLAGQSGVWLGHMLASYALEFEPAEVDGGEPGGRWREATLEAIDSTQRAFPGGEVWAYLDRKSFKGWQRQALIRFLEGEGIPIGRTSDLVPGAAG